MIAIWGKIVTSLASHHRARKIEWEGEGEKEGKDSFSSKVNTPKARKGSIDETDVY